MLHAWCMDRRFSKLAITEDHIEQTQNLTFTNLHHTQQACQFIYKNYMISFLAPFEHLMFLYQKHILSTLFFFLYFLKRILYKLGHLS